MNKSGFTLLEIIIVIIIVGVLASLALPRFFGTIEYSKAQEALTNLAVLRRSMGRCYLFDLSYADCDVTNLDVEDPNMTTGALFTYRVDSGTGTFLLTAENRDEAANYITINQDGVKTGAGIYANIR